MGLKYDKKFLSIAFLSSLIFLGLFLGFTLLDINTREDQLPFTKPAYSGKEMPLESGHGNDRGHGSAVPTELKKEGAPRVEPVPGGGSPPAAHPAGEAKKEEAKPAASATPAGGAKH